MNIPNALSILRIFLTAPMVYTLVHQQYNVFVALFSVAVLSDWLDGWYARVFKQMTQVGAWLDPLADKVLLNSLLLVFTLLGHLYWFVFLVVSLRDVLLILGACFYFKRHGQIAGQAIWIGKLTTAFQFLIIFALLIHSYDNTLESLWAVNCLSLLVMLLTIYSGSSYFSLWWRSLVNTRSQLE